MSTGAVAEPEMDEGSEAVFNVNVFSNKELQVEVVGHDDHTPGSGASRKRHREEDKGDDLEDIDSSCTVSSTPVLRVETIYVSSAILAAKSSFFYKLFSNGVKESTQWQATVRTADSEEKAFMELLRFMHSGKLTATTKTTPLVDLQMAADKLEVISCTKLCVQLLMVLPMTPESAVMCLDLSCPISMAADLIEEAKKFLAERFQDELMRIPPAGIEAILSRNDFGVATEVPVYDFVLRWACSPCPNSEERRNISSSRLLCWSSWSLYRDGKKQRANKGSACSHATHPMKLTLNIIESEF